MSHPKYNTKYYQHIRIIQNKVKIVLSYISHPKYSKI